LSRLDTFVAPVPSPLLIKALVPVNRVLCLGGVPGLRALPLLGRLPGIRGLADIRSIDLPELDEARLRASAAPDCATFITPNHPEFFTDWMLDKELLARTAPLAACWATNSIVNGMGPLAQKFWLKNNLIAQIPGVGGGAAKVHSIAWAAKGHGVLLHPEGTVGWHGDRIGRLFPGAVEMAATAAAVQREGGRPSRALVQPVVWKFVLTEDASEGLARELGHVETQLDLAERQGTLAERIIGAYRTLLARDAETWAIAKFSNDSYGAQQRYVLDALADRLGALLGAGLSTDLSGTSDPEPRLRPLVRAAERRLRQPAEATEDRRTEIKGLAETIRRILRFRPSLYPTPELTQEHLAENIKRLRGDYCGSTFADRFDRMVPRPAGPRIAHIRVPESVDVGAALGSSEGLSEARIETLVAELKQRMQVALDAINVSVNAGPRTRSVANVFHR
jgi:hypothetical protein